jgi:hypothetical protein
MPNNRRFRPRDYYQPRISDIPTQQLQVDLNDINDGITQIEARLKHSGKLPDGQERPGYQEWRSAASVALSAFVECKALIDKELQFRQPPKIAPQLAQNNQYMKLIELLKKYDFSGDSELNAIIQASSPAQ